MASATGGLNRKAESVPGSAVGSLKLSPPKRRFHRVVNWLHSLSIFSLLLVTCAAAALVTVAIYLMVTRLAAAGQRDTLTAVSPGLLPPMALVFGLLIGFLAAGVWTNNSNAQQAVDSEASALRSVDLLDRAFPAADQRRLDLLIRSYIEQVVAHEWPAMAHQNATLVTAPPQMALALQVALALPADNPGRVVAQREIVTSLEAALDARRQRIIISQSAVNSAKWAGVIALGILTLIAIACVHAANRPTAAIAMTLWASAVVVSLLMIGAQDRPFAGPYRVQPTPLVQVEPQIPT
jgi:hypothetical protein